VRHKAESGSPAHKVGGALSGNTLVRNNPGAAGDATAAYTQHTN